MARFFTSASMAMLFLAINVASYNWAQERYVWQNRIVNIERPVTKMKLVQETVYEDFAIADQIPVIETETRYRRTITQRPVVKDRILEERYEVLKPVTETSVKNVEIEETVFQEVTEMRAQPVWVEKAVQETRYREEQVIVRKPVETVRYEPQQVTTYRPEIQQETVYAPSEMMSLNPGTTQLEWVRRGYYYDAARGGYIYRRPGMHWVSQPPTVSTQPVLVPQTTAKTVLVPEVQTTYKPVVVSETRETIETRRVPYTVEKTHRVLENKEVPVVVKKPVVQRRVEQVPETTIRYETQEVVKRTPFKETTWETVEEAEPYQVQVQKNVTQPRIVQVPKTVVREIPYTTTETIQRVIAEKIPVDAQGCPIPQTPTETTIRDSVFQTTMRPTIDLQNSESFGAFQVPTESQVLKSSRVIDPSQDEARGENPTTTQGSESQPRSVLTLDSKQLRPIGERPKPVEAEMPPSIEPPKSMN